MWVLTKNGARKINKDFLTKSSLIFCGKIFRYFDIVYY